jgi:hypothetical protein
MSITAIIHNHHNIATSHSYAAVAYHIVSPRPVQASLLRLVRMAPQRFGPATVVFLGGSSTSAPQCESPDGAILSSLAVFTTVVEYMCKDSAVWPSDGGGGCRCR